MCCRLLAGEKSLIEDGAAISLFSRLGIPFDGLCMALAVAQPLINIRASDAYALALPCVAANW